MSMSLSDYHEIILLRDALNKELDDAIAAEQARRKPPPLELSAMLLRHRSLQTLPMMDDYLNRLADYLEGKHRRKRGKRLDASLQRQIHWERLWLFVSIKHDCGYTAAINYVAEKERVHESNILESISKARKYMKEICKTEQGKRDAIISSLEIMKSARTKRMAKEAKSQTPRKKK